MKKRNLILPVAAAALALAGLVGCTAPSAPATNPKTGSHSAAAAPATPIPTIPTGTGIIRDAKLTSCATTGTSVVAKGEVTMPKDSTGDVVISVSWVNSQDSSVYGRGTTTVKGLKAGDKKEWTTNATLPPGATSVACVLGAVIPK
ncbi:MAG: hypothetical protein ACTHJI_02785 [Leifsonia sp.]